VLCAAARCSVFPITRDGGSIKRPHNQGRTPQPLSLAVGQNLTDFALIRAAQTRETDFSPRRLSHPDRHKHRQPSRRAPRLSWLRRLRADRPKQPACPRALCPSRRLVSRLRGAGRLLRQQSCACYSCRSMHLSRMRCSARHNVFICEPTACVSTRVAGAGLLGAEAKRRIRKRWLSRIENGLKWPAPLWPMRTWRTQRNKQQSARPSGEPKERSLAFPSGGRIAPYGPRLLCVPVCWMSARRSGIAAARRRRQPSRRERERGAVK